jgi:hypothetical protein
MGIKLIALAATTLVLSTNVNAVTLTFDDIPSGSIQNISGNMPTYQDFNFSHTLDWVDVVGSSWNYGAVSGDFAILNNDSGTGVITEASNADFTFDGLWAKKWSTSPESGGTDTLSGTLSGFNNGSLVWQVSTGLNGSYEYYGAQAGLIDELHLGFGNVFLVDNLSLNGVSTVPVPAAVWLFGSGLIGLIGLARRKAHV